ncbi:UvrD-helicase domain-containing protein [Thauera sp.]|uniref:UvrD-helicase domain-containing protein n=1 Tax=Thauera sp. TaxID=1905334 RepID=UPI002BB81D8E|nr:UvrD-helicase domain-containing protein [Thauera sp.]HRP25549.1 UvrD-helicase domain-containing protein [Thauera sp.]
MLDDIRQHFLDELGVRFAAFIGTPERPNLHFEVFPVTAGEKFARTHALLLDELGDRDGGAVVFVASRKKAEELADFLLGQNWSCRYFHAGLQPHEKEDIQDDFLRRYFAGKEDVLQLATSEGSWKAIIEALNPTQKAIVTDHEDRNRLVLAGPGSGKTRVVVHRIAYLLRVRRVPAAAIIALTFNRHAANEIRTRLFALVGKDAIGITVLTYHAMAMRLTGTSFERRDKVEEGELDAVLDRAAALLEGGASMEGENDLRERLLQGYRYILVDEYQDIDDRQYRLVSALAGRHDEQDGELCILAVGDDDQNIYQWRGGSNRHIARFCEEYGAQISFLVENYRSSRAIIAAANQLIEHNAARLKAEHPIRIDQARAAGPAGGQWEALDPARRGSVLRLRVAGPDRPCGNLQAQAAVAELDRLRALDGRADWQGFAVLARSHRYLWPVQALCERAGIAYFLATDKQSGLPLTRHRPFVRLVAHLRARAGPALAAAAVAEIAREHTADPLWGDFFATAFEQLGGEYGDCLLAPATVIDWLYDYARELRQQARPGLFLGTVHAAKGLEFGHVALLDGNWEASSEQLDEARRLYYVGMTRAEQTLTLCEFDPGNAFVAELGACTQYRRFEGSHDPALDAQYQVLGLGDVDIGFAGRQHPGAPVHQAISRLEPGDPLTLRADGDRCALFDLRGNKVGRTARAFRLALEPERCEVAGIVVRYKEETEPAYMDSVKCEQWEVVVPRLRGSRVG